MLSNKFAFPLLSTAYYTVAICVVIIVLLVRTPVSPLQRFVARWYLATTTLVPPHWGTLCRGELVIGDWFGGAHLVYENWIKIFMLDMIVLSKSNIYWILCKLVQMSSEINGFNCCKCTLHFFNFDTVWDLCFARIL